MLMKSSLESTSSFLTCNLVDEASKINEIQSNPTQNFMKLTTFESVVPYLLALHVGAALDAEELGDAGPPDGGGDGLDGRLD